MMPITFRPVPKVSCEIFHSLPSSTSQIERILRKTQSPQMMTLLTSTWNKALQYHPHQTATRVRNYPSCVKPHAGIGLLQQLAWLARWIQLVCAVISL